MLHKMKRVKDFLMQEMPHRKGNIVKYSALERIRIQILGSARMEPKQIKEKRLGGIMALSKLAELPNSPLF